MSADKLRFDYINSLPQPFIAVFRDGWSWPVHDIEVGTGLVRIDVMGKLDVKHISDVARFRDANGNDHNPDTFYSDCTPMTPSPNSNPPTEAAMAAAKEIFPGLSLGFTITWAASIIERHLSASISNIQAERNVLQTALNKRLEAYLSERVCCSGENCGCMGATRLQEMIAQEAFASITSLRSSLASIEGERDRWKKYYYDVADAICKESSGPDNLVAQAKALRADLAAAKAEVTRVEGVCKEHFDDGVEYLNSVIELKADVAQLRADLAAKGEEVERCQEIVRRYNANIMQDRLDAQRYRETLERISRDIPVFNEGSFIVIHHDGEGNETGVEQVDPVAIVMNIASTVDAALAARTPGKDDKGEK